MTAILCFGADGIGTMEYMNGDVYHGQWYQGDMHGKVITKETF